MSQAHPISIERPRTQSKARLLLIPARIILGAVFIYAAYAKLHFNGAWHLRDYYFFFAMGIDSYKMLPLAIVEWMAKILPWLELGLGTLLIVGAGVRWVGLMVTALLVVFMAALAHAALGESRGVNGTPSIYVFHKGQMTPLPPGGVNYSLLKQYLDYLLQQH